MIPKKSLGQHFLQCRWVTDALIKAAELTRHDTVLEIGPGTGVLTRPLAASCGTLMAVEKDEALAAALSDTLKKEHITNVRIIPGDILKILPELEAYDKVVANIPYYLTGRLLRMILECQNLPQTIILTIQKEVAERITARAPHTNILGLSVAAFGAPELLATVPVTCFLPKPRVDSAIIKISSISRDFFERHGIPEHDFFFLVRAAFSGKRKMLVNTLSRTQKFGAKDDAKKKIARALDLMHLPRTVRPQELTLEQWGILVKYLLPPPQRSS